MRPCNKLYCLLCNILLLFCFSNNITAQPFYVKKYTINDGLPASYILKIYQDSQGFLWIGSLNGLSRFDGKEFVNYGSETGLPHLMIDAIYEDHQHRLWVGTRNGIVEVKGKQCIVYPLDDNQKIDFVFNIQESRSKELWSLTSNGLYQFEKDHWKKIRLYPGLENQQCRQIVETDTGMFVNYGNQVLFKKNNGALQLSAKKEYKKEWTHYRQLTEMNNSLYLSTANGLLEINGKDTSYLFREELRNKYVMTFFKDSRSRFWIYTFQGELMVSAPGNKEHLSRQFTGNLSADNDPVFDFFEDREGNIWIARAQGLWKLKTVDYVSYDKNRNPLIREISNLIVTPGKKIIVADATNGLLTYDRNNNVFGKLTHSYSTPFDHKLLLPFTIDAWCYDEQNHLWLVSRGQRLFLLENNSLKDLSELIGKNIQNILGITYNPKSHAIFICSDTLQTGNEHGLNNFRSVNDSSYIILPKRIHYFSNGRMLAWNPTTGFLIIDEYQKCFQVDIGNRTPVNRYDGVNIYDDPSGRFWVTSSRGMMRYKWDEKMLPVKDIEITTQQGLPNNAIGAIAFDSLHRIWVTTLSGIAVIEIDSIKNNAIKVNRLSEEQGIVSDNWYESKMITDGNGNIWASLYDRIIRFKSGQVQFEKDAPSIVIDNIQLNSKETNWSQWSDSLTGVLQLPYQPKLPYNKNNLSIAYEGIAFNGNSGLLYSYKLEGTESNWSEPTKSTIVSFVGLPSGKYIFQVRARKSNSEWSQPAIFPFIIQKSIPETWWFRLLAVAIATLLLSAIFRNRIRQVRKKAFVQHRLQELEMKALKSQMNPHFIYNAMNSIQALVLGKKTEEASLYISKFGRLLRQVLDNSEKNAITMENELQSLELYIELEKLRLNVDLQYQINLNEGVNPEEEQMPPLIFQPFVENALWHGLSSKEGEKKIFISVNVQNSWLIAEIEDNGIGRMKALAVNEQKHEVKKSKGIEITSKRLAEFNMTPGISPVEIIDLYNDRNQPSGTKVLIRIKRLIQSPDISNP
jgi:ligand-binding sensor domain-containing protein